jgi:hypothetical protein
VAIDSFDPNAELGFDWYRAFLAAAPAIARNTSLELALTGGPAPGWDSVQMAYDDFPLMVGIVSGTILLVVGIALKSVLIPLRSLLAVALTLGFCYGSASLVYEWGVLDWMGFMGLHTMSPHDRALLWMPPLVSFGIIVGLCLDYDLFLLIRVADFRKSGGGMAEPRRRGARPQLDRPDHHGGRRDYGGGVLRSAVLVDDGDESVGVFYGIGGAVRHVCRAHAARARADVADGRRRLVARPEANCATIHLQLSHRLGASGM